jgi:hypothetical protein
VSLSGELVVVTLRSMSSADDGPARRARTFCQVWHIVAGGISLAKTIPPASVLFRSRHADARMKR